MLQGQLSNEFASFDKLYDWFAQDLSSRDHIQSALEGLDSHANLLRELLSGATLLTDEVARKISENKKHYDDKLNEKLAEIEDAEDRKADMQRDDWSGRWQEHRYEAENGRFADVDE
jgi:NurA-like 5'-3' nuclease